MDIIKILTPNCATFNNGELALVKSEEGIWIIINKSGKVIWSEK